MILDYLPLLHGCSAKLVGTPSDDACLQALPWTEVSVKTLGRHAAPRRIATLESLGLHRFVKTLTPASAKAGVNRKKRRRNRNKKRAPVDKNVQAQCVSVPDFNDSNVRPGNGSAGGSGKATHREQENKKKETRHNNNNEKPSARKNEQRNAGSAEDNYITQEMLWLSDEQRKNVEATELIQEVATSKTKDLQEAVHRYGYALHAHLSLIHI